MDTPVSSVTVVGGGTAGWLAALMLHTRLNSGRRAPPIRIALIESPTVPIIGVGEGSLVGLAKEFERMGIREDEFVRRCNATFKLGVRFVDWNAADSGQAYTYVHPVSYGPEWIGGKNPLYHYLAFGAQPGRDPYTAVDSLDPIVEAIRLHRAPRSAPEAWFKGEFFNYAYHFDATRLAEYLRDVAVRRGVVHILDDVDDAMVGEDGIVSQLKLRRNGLFPVELVIDCTGFRGLIISKILGEPFHSYGSSLLCDRAVAIQLPYRDGEQIESCTAATALSAGWVWRIPLFNRVGTGYVFSSAFSSDEDAIRSLCRHLRVDPEAHQPRVLPMRIGRVRRAWVGNCIAVGLSGGFIEPLEATAIMASIATVFLITRHFPPQSMPETLRANFNRRIDALYDGIRDFIVMHYYLADRTEPFWLAARAPAILSERLRDNLELWRHRLPDPEDLARPAIFSEKSYGLCLAAKRFFRDCTLFYQANVSRADWARFGAHVEGVRRRVRALPSACDLLLRIRGETTWPHRAGAATPLGGEFPIEAAVASLTPATVDINRATGAP